MRANVWDVAAAVGRVTAGLDAALDAVAAVDLASVESGELLQELAALAVVANRLAAVESALLAAVEARRLEGAYGGTRTTSELLSAVSPIAPKPARERVELALSVTPRRTLSGEVLPAIAPVTAAGCAEGRVSTAHAAVIVATLDRVPDWCDAATVEAVETALVGCCAVEHPYALRRTAAALLARLDQDGPEPDEGDAEIPLAQRRGLWRRVRRNGLVRYTLDLTPTDADLVDAVIEPLSTPRPAPTNPDAGSCPGVGAGSDAAESDDRSAAQRRADAVLEALSRLLTGDVLPHVNGAPVTVVVTVPLADLQNRRGVGISATGVAWPVRKLLDRCHTAYTPLILGERGEPLWLGRTVRLASPAQWKALIARDRGCSHPGCDRPPSWCQAHHIEGWAEGGPTDIDHLTLLCARHHRALDTNGWQVTIHDGRAEWTPPPWIDPSRRPRTNRTHHPPDLAFRRPG